MAGYEDVVGSFARGMALLGLLGAISYGTALLDRPYRGLVGRDGGSGRRIRTGM